MKIKFNNINSILIGAAVKVPETTLEISKTLRNDSMSIYYIEDGLYLLATTPQETVILSRVHCEREGTEAPSFAGASELNLTIGDKQNTYTDWSNGDFVMDFGKETIFCHIFARNLYADVKEQLWCTVYKGTISYYIGYNVTSLDYNIN